MSLSVGDVLYLYNTQIKPEHSKYSACVHIKPNYFLLINTENRKMYECLPILRSDNKYLQHDSYIGCSNYYVYDDDKIKDEQIVGHLGYKDLNALYFHLKNNVKKMPKKIKDEILLSLNNALDDLR